MKTNSARDLKISVIVPTFNRAHTLHRSLDSVFAQTLMPYECIVVDDGSTDDTPLILQKYQSRYPTLMKSLRRVNGGAGSARNAGLEHAAGNMIAFLDSDDEWLPDHLEWVNHVCLDSRVDFVHANHIKRFIDGTCDGGRAWDERVAEDRSALFRSFHIKTSTVVIRRALLDELDEWFMEENRSCQDYEFFWRVLAVSREIRWRPKPSAITWVTAGSEIVKRTNASRLVDNLYAREKVYESLRSKCCNEEILRAIKKGQQDDMGALLREVCLESPDLKAMTRTVRESVVRQGFWWTTRTLAAEAKDLWFRKKR